MADEKRISVAVLGTYVEEELIYALNSIMSQDYPDMELIISMNELDIPVCAVIDTLNANRRESLGRVRINTEKQAKPLPYHIRFISSHMQGDWLVCLWNGAALYAADSLSRCVAGGSGELLMGLHVLFEDSRGYAGEKRGGILFPKQFVKSAAFDQIDFTRNLEQQLQAELKYCEVLLIRSGVRPHLPDHKAYAGSILDKNLECWMRQTENGFIQLNASAYGMLKRGVESCRDSRKEEDGIAYIDGLTEYLIVKQKNGKWQIKDSDKALICHMLRIKRILLQKHHFVRTILRRYVKKLGHAQQKRAVMVVNEYHLWRSCFKSVYDCLVRNDYRVDIVYTPFAHNRIKTDPALMLEQWDKSGYAYELGENYNISASSPDILFFCKPYDVADEKWCIREVEKVIRRIIYIPYNMAYMRTGKESRRLMYQLPMHYIAWKQIVYNQTVSDMIDRYSYNPENKLFTGHPKYDAGIKDFTKEEQALFCLMKKRAGGKKIILWNTHFAVDLSDADGAGTFLNFGIDFLKKIGRAQDYFVIWRPHPMFWNSLRGGGYKYMDQIRMLIKDAVHAERLYVDNGSSQWPAVFASDLLISDASSLIETWMIYNKPLILTQRTGKETPVDHVVRKASALEELERAVADWLQNGDSLREIRKHWIEQNYYLPPKGQSTADKILEEIEKSW